VAATDDGAVAAAAAATAAARSASARRRAPRRMAAMARSGASHGGGEGVKGTRGGTSRDRLGGRGERRAAVGATGGCVYRPLPSSGPGDPGRQTPGSARDTRVRVFGLDSKQGQAARDQSGGGGESKASTGGPRRHCRHGAPRPAHEALRRGCPSAGSTGLAPPHRVSPTDRRRSDAVATPGGTCHVSMGQQGPRRTAVGKRHGGGGLGHPSPASAIVRGSLSIGRAQRRAKRSNERTPTL